MKVGVIFAFLGLLSLKARSQELVVYFPSTVAPIKIEKSLKEIKSVDIKAFAKFSDFDYAVSSAKPRIVMAPSIFGDENTDYKSLGSVARNGKNESKMVLIALDASWKSKDVSAGKVGAIEVAKRSKMKSYIENAFSKSFKLVKTVSKAEDLFPLLVFKSVDFIAVDRAVLDELKAKFSTQVFEVLESKAEPFVSIFVREGVQDSEIKELKTFDISTINK